MTKKFTKIIIIILLLSLSVPLPAIGAISSEPVAPVISSATSDATAMPTAPDTETEVTPEQTPEVPAAAKAKPDKKVVPAKKSETQTLNALSQSGSTTTPEKKIYADPLTSARGFQDVLSYDLFTGEARISLPIKVAPGRRSLTPEINLAYSSFKKDLLSPYGYGWDLSVSSIYRAAPQGTDKLYTQNEFAVRIAGQYNELALIDAGSGLYQGKLANDFNKYYFQNNTWQVQDTAGNKYYFGATATARQTNPADSNQTFQWFLTRVEDLFGNAITYQYFQDRGQVYLQEIKYVFTGAEQSLYSVQFQYAPKTVSAVSYVTGFKVETFFLLDKILIGDQEYDFIYDRYDQVLSRLGRMILKSGVSSLPALDLSYYSTGPDQNLLKTVTTNTGGIIELEYLDSTVYRNTSGGVSNFVPFSVNTLHRLTYRELVTNSVSVKTFNYLGGHYYFDYQDVAGRQYAGFHQVEAIDDFGKTVTYFHQSELSPDNAVSSGQGEYADHISKKGRIYRQEVYDPAGKLFQTSITKWAHQSLGNDRYLVTPERETNLTWDGGSSHREQAVTYAYDGYGNITSQINWGEVQANPATGEFTDIGTDKLTSVNTYVYNTTNNLVSGFRTVQKTYDINSTRLSESHAYYDDLVYTQISVGNVTREEQWVAANTWINVYHQYNSAGLVVRETDPRNNSTTITYDAYTLYPAAVTNALGQTVNFTYDYRSGQVKRQTDPNNIITENNYDGFGRLTSILISDQAQSGTLKIKQEVAYNDQAVPRSTVARDYRTSENGAAETYQYYDGFGRLAQARSSSETSGTYTVGSLFYDSRGRVVKEYLPIFAAGSAYAATIQPTTQASQYSYDTVDRVIQIVTSVGSTVNQYALWTTTTTDASSHQKYYYYDAAGRVIQVDENNYTYDPLGRLVKIIDAEANVRNFTYDALGRQLTAELAHKSSASVTPYQYQYDASGNRTRQTDPAGKIVNWTYDSLNRALTQNEVAYTYDTANYGIGQLAAVAIPAGRTAYTYDRQGLVKQEELSFGQSAPAGPQPATYWSFDEGTGLVATDNSDHGNNGTLNGAMTTSDYIFGISKYALDLDGSDDYISKAAPTFIDDAQGAVSLWVKFDTLASTRMLWSVSVSGSTDDEFYCTLNKQNALEIVLNVNGGATMDLVTRNNVITNNNWHHVVLTTSASQLKLYVDGVVENFVSGPGLGQVAWFGNAPDANIFSVGGLVRRTLIAPLDGVVDEMKVFSTGLSESEVTALYQVPGPQPTAYWSFDEGSGLVATDRSGHGNNGTLNGAMTTSDYIPGISNYALDLDGSDDYISKAAPTFIDDAQGAVSLWVRIDNLTKEQVIWSASTNGQLKDELYLAFRGDANKRLLVAMIVNVSTQIDMVTDVNVITDNNWHHLVLTTSASQLKLYVDGVAKNFVAGRGIGQLAWFGNTPDANVFSVGGLLRSSFVAPFNGDVDETRVFSAGLSESEVMALYQRSGGQAVSSFVTRYEHDDFGALQKVVYPDSRSVEYDYNVLGQIEVARQNTSAVVTSVDYAPTGAVSQIIYANGVKSVYTYDADKLYRLTNKKTTAASVILQNISYTFDAVGNITRIVDTGVGTPKDAAYTYDALDRLTRAAITVGATTTTENYTYSAAGNILSKTGVGSYVYADPRHPAAVTSAGGNTYTYDASGNLISTLPTAGAATTYTYDSLNRLVKVVNPAGTSQYVYGAGYDRIQKITPGGHVRTYLGQLAEVTETGAFTDYIFAGDTRVATVDTSGVYYHSNDHLSSASLITNASAGVVQKLDYYPFGSERLNEKFASFETRFSFTDQEKDAETGLMYYGARYYDPVIGRFTSVDPVVIDTNRKEFVMALANPQLLNAYSYVGNNPLKYVDYEGEAVGAIVAIGIAVVGGYYLVKNYDKMYQSYVQGNDEQANIYANNANNAVFYTGFAIIAWMEAALTFGLNKIGQKNNSPQPANSLQAIRLSNSQAQQVLQDAESSAQGAYGRALAGGTHSGTITNYANTPTDQIQNGITSFQKRIDQHCNFLQNPELKVKDWATKTLRDQTNIINSWIKEINIYTQEREVLTGILQQRGGGGE